MKKLKEFIKNIYLKIKNFFVKVDKTIDNGVEKTTNKFSNFWTKYNFIFFLGIFTVLALVLKYALAPIPSWDYISFIQSWMYKMKMEGGFIKGLVSLYEMQGVNQIFLEGIGITRNVPVCDYPPLYMYFLSIFSCFPLGEVKEASGSWNAYYYYETLIYCVKTLSFIFEIILAIFAYKIVKKVSNSKVAGCTAYTLFLFLPTIILNGATWGQCDVCYASMVVASVYYLMDKKQIRSMIFFGLALAFKMQCIFILPLFGFAWFRKSFKIRYFIFAFLVLFATFLPLWIGGAQFETPFVPYGRQIGGYVNRINLNSTNIYTFFTLNGNAYNDYVSVLSTFGMILTVVCSFALISLLALKRVKVTPASLLLVATFSVIMVPFVMPHMHERYFYLAETFLLIYACTKLNRIHLPIIQQVSGLIAYSAYGIIRPKGFPNDEDGTNIALCIGTLLNMFVIGFLIYDLAKLEKEEKVVVQEAIKIEEETNKKEEL